MAAAPHLKLVTEKGTMVDERAMADLGYDDIANAERLIKRHGEDLRRTSGIGIFAWDKKRWLVEPDPSPQAMLRAQRTARSIRDEAKAIEREGANMDGDVKKEYDAKVAKHFKWATASANSNRLNAMQAQAWPHLIVDKDDWNAKPFLFNAQNLTLDLESVEVKTHAHRRDDLITHVAGVAYDPEATCPEFRKFIDRILPPAVVNGGEDRSLQKFVQRALGRCLVDSVSDQSLVVFHGGGANGKSTLLNAIAAVLGDYCMTVSVQSILYAERSGSGPSPDIARLAERPRLMRVSEPEPGAKLAEGGVKSMTGGEPIVARRLNEPPIEFHIVGKIVLSCNSRPVIKGGDDGIWRRIMLVPFKVQIPPDEQREKGPALEAALKREAPGILNWMIEGLADYYECGGLAPPESVLEETAAYRAESDEIGRFVGECCDKGTFREVHFDDLFTAYKMWTKLEGQRDPPNPRYFGKKLSDRGFERRKSNGLVLRVGLSLNDEWVEKIREIFAGAGKEKTQGAEDEA